MRNQEWRCEVEEREQLEGEKERQELEERRGEEQDTSRNRAHDIFPSVTFKSDDSLRTTANST